MPSVAWKTVTPVEADTPCVIVTTTATVRRYRDLPRFSTAAGAMWASFQAAEGLLGYEMSAEIGSRRLTTISAWRDADALAAFAGGSAHQQAVTATRPLVTDSKIWQQHGFGHDLPNSFAAGHHDSQVEQAS